MLDERDRKKRKLKRKAENALVWFAVFLITIVGLRLIFHSMLKKETEVFSELKESETEAANAVDTTKKSVPKPEIQKQHLTINEFSRPGEKVDAVEKIVIHYLANPMTTAQQNRDYFENLKDFQNDSMSANFIVGLEGEIIECVPPGEIAYASNSMNHLSVSIENCHPDTTGKFTEETYESCVALTAYLVDHYGLGRDDIIRHYDVTGKECPLYFVRYEKEWQKFKDDVMNDIEKAKQ